VLNKYELDKGVAYGLYLEKSISYKYRESMQLISSREVKIDR